MPDPISICLPKGENLEYVAGVLRGVGFPVEGYESDNRTYRPAVRDLPVRAKIFAEKNVVTQVAFGNYQLGFCGLDWIEEYRARFKRSGLDVLLPLPGGRKKLVVAAHESAGAVTIDEVRQAFPSVRIVSEYPHLAERFAIRRRLRNYHSYPAWGKVENYPPEHAELAVLAVGHEDEVRRLGLVPIEVMLVSTVCVIVHRRAFAERDLSPVLEYVGRMAGGAR
jgi:ATP phosphoribosyltransferase